MISRCATFFFLLIVIQLWATPAQAEKTISQTDTMLADIRDNIARIKNMPNLGEALSLRILKAYYAAEDNLEDLQNQQQQIKETQRQLKNLPSEIKQLEKQIEKAELNNKNQTQTDYSSFSSDKLEQRLINEKLHLNELQTSINELNVETPDELNQQQRIRKQITELKASQASTQQERTSLETQVSDKQELEARQKQLDSRSRMINATLSLLDLQHLVYPLSSKAQKLRRQLLTLQMERQSSLIETIEKLLAIRGQQEIDQTQAQLIKDQQDAANKHELIQQATKENIQYTQGLQNISYKQKENLNLIDNISKRYKQLDQDFQSAEQKIKLAGLSPALGNLLREQRRNMPVSSHYQNEFTKLKEEIAAINLELFKLEEAKKSLQDIDQAVQHRLNSVASNNLDHAEKLKIRDELRPLLINQVELVNSLISAYSEYARTLADVDFSLHQLVSLGESFSQYLDQRLLWIPTAPIINKHYVQNIFASLLWLIEPSKWLTVLFDIKGSIEKLPFLTAIGLILIALPLWFKKTIKQNLKELLAKSVKSYSDRFVFTFYGFGYLFLLVLPPPLLLVCIGGQLYAYEKASTFSHAVGLGLMNAAVPLLIIQFFYRLFKPNGIAQALFNWQDENARLVYGQLKWIQFVVIPVTFVIGVLSQNGYSQYSNSLGRMALIIALLSLTYLLHRFVHPSKGLAKGFYVANSTSWVYYLRYPIYFIFVFIPPIIIGFAIFGYFQSALELQHKLVIMLRLIFFTTLFYEVVIRWMVLTNRQLALQNARQKRKLHEQEEAQEKGVVETSIPDETLILDIPKINEQSKKILNSTVIVILIMGGWLTLSDLLPAFSIFDHVVLWQHKVQINDQEALESITLTNVFVCIFYLVLMLIFIKNFPGLIDMLFVGRYSMTAGSRYAFIQLTRYAVISITFIAGANEMGGSWSQVQWLVAAVSVGLGFGLQEIFANMVSGIILLFERPIRVGDTVTVGDVSGKVSRIQIRATTITDWDQKELVVPNKSFITDKLINWTLTDTVTRLVIEVGISYDSDVDLAKKIMKQVIEQTPHVLKEPEPSIYFLGFGESSLDFNLRVYVSDLSNRLPVNDDIHRKIFLAFKEHNIEIPFPQRDLHVR